ncbi:MAG: hypothetical protein QM770_24265 [Tepidisphaeraceae bacterium]
MRIVIPVCLALGFLVGCESTGPSDHDDLRSRQDAALKDPFGYGPKPGSFQKGSDDYDPTDISGGGTMNLDKRGMKRDLDRVFNP